MEESKKAEYTISSPIAFFFWPEKLFQTSDSGQYTKQVGSQLYCAINYSLVSLSSVTREAPEGQTLPQLYPVTQQAGISRTVPISHNYLFLIRAFC